MATYITPHLIAKESLIALENECVLANLVYRKGSLEAKGQGATVSYRQPAEYTAASVSATVNINTHTESSVDVVLNQLFDVTIQITDVDLSLSVADFREQHIAPAMRAHAQSIDAAIATEMYKNFAGHYAVTSTPVVKDIANLGAVQSVLKAPLRDRRLVFHPVTKADYVSLDSFLHADKRADGGKALREASMGRVLGYDCYEDQNVPTVAGGNVTGGTATALLCGAGASAATVATIDGVVNGSVIKAYDLFKVTGYDEWHIISANGTSNGTVIVQFQPPFKVANADDSAVTFQEDSARRNLAFHKNAFILATSPLMKPIGGALAAVETYKGLSCRVVMDYLPLYKTNILSIDMLYGIKTLNRDLGAQLFDGR